MGGFSGQLPVAGDRWTVVSERSTVASSLIGERPYVAEGNESQRRLEIAGQVDVLVEVKEENL